MAMSFRNTNFGNYRALPRKAYPFVVRDAKEATASPGRIDPTGRYKYVPRKVRRQQARPHVTMKALRAAYRTEHSTVVAVKTDRGVRHERVFPDAPGFRAWLRAKDTGALSPKAQKIKNGGK